MSALPDLHALVAEPFVRAGIVAVGLGVLGALARLALSAANGEGDDPWADPDNWGGR